MEHEHNDLSWNATLALMARLLSESNENSRMKFNDELHEQLFAMFIAESNSATYRMWEWNKEETMYGFINTIKSEYENCWEDRSVHESFMDSVLREVKGE